MLANTLARTHGILERYTQPAVRSLIEAGVDPLSISPRRHDRIVFFADVVGFTPITSVLDPIDTIAFASTFAEVCTIAVRENGGEVVEGNVGSPEKMDYTLLGDAVNRAAHLESRTRRLPWRLALGRRVADVIDTGWSRVGLGAHSLKVRGRTVEVLSIADPITRKPTVDHDDQMIQRFVDRARDTSARRRRRRGSAARRPARAHRGPPAVLAGIGSA